MFGLPKSYLAETFVSFISERLKNTSNFYFTLFEGRYCFKVSQTHASKGKYSLTIGDDIDLMYDQLRIFKRNGFYRTKSLSTFLKSDDSLVNIKCKRKTYTTRAGLKTAIRKWVIYSILLILVILIMQWFSFNSDSDRGLILWLAAYLVVVYPALFAIVKTSAFIYDFLRNERSELNVFIKILLYLVMILVFCLFLSLVLYFFPKLIIKFLVRIKLLDTVYIQQ